MGPAEHTADEGHGRTILPLVEVRSYSLPLKDGSEFLGDQASGSEFREILDEQRDEEASGRRTPFGAEATEDIDGEDLDRALYDHGSVEARTVEGAVTEFAERFASVLLRFLSTAEWSGTERIVCGGGLVEGDVGRELVARAEVLVREVRPSVELRTLHHDPDDAGMIGWAFVAPPELLAQGNGFLAVDIGGTNVRWGIVRIDGPALRAASYEVVCNDKWCHADGEPSRDDVVEQISSGLRSAIEAAERYDVRLAPFVGLSCPGLIAPDGRILRGGQNLPGDWSDDDFVLPREVAARIGDISGSAPLVLLHNDAVVQALSESPLMLDVENWAAVTMGTGLGNCSFRRRL